MNRYGRSLDSAAKTRSPRTVSVWPVGFLLMAALTGCTDEPGGQEPFVVRDSAGIRIAENYHIDDNAAFSWSISAEPVLRLGLLETDGPEQFTDIEVTRLSSNTIVVLELRSSELRFFDAQGNHLRTAGGIGGGPGEFRQAYTLVRTSKDTLLVQDLQDRSILVFSPDGEFLRKLSADPFPVGLPGLNLARSCFKTPLLPDGSLLLCGEIPGITPLAAGAPDISQPGRHRHTVQLIRVPPESESFDSLGVFTRSEFYTLVVHREGLPSLTNVVHPFQPQGYLAVSRDPMRLLMANNRDASVEIWKPDGGLERIVRWHGAERSPSREESDLAFSELLAGVHDLFADRARTEVSPPSAIPAIYGLIAGPEGEVWVQREPFLKSHTRTLFDVFDGEGRYVAGVNLPIVLEVREVGHDYVLGIRRDEFGVPFVEMFSLSRQP